MRILLIFFYLLLIVIGISFAALNASSVTVNFYFTLLKMPISVLMIVTLGAGVIIGLVLFLPRYWRIKSDCRKLKQQLKITETEIKNLRAIPLQNQH